MARKLAILAFIIVGLNICVILTLGTSPSGSFLTNCLQTCSSALAAALCFGASRRGRGLSRPFWLLVGLGMATWGLSNLGWMYYENWLHAEVPRFSAVRILFDVQGVFYMIALFLNKEQDSPNFDLETVLDSTQIAVVFFSVFFGLYYMQFFQSHQTPTSELVLSWILVAINLTLTVIAAIQTASAPTRRLRSLYGGLTLFLLVYTIGSGIAEFAISDLHLPTGSWYGLSWTVSFLVGAVWAARWKDTSESPAVTVSRPKTLGRFTVSNLMLALAPLAVLILVAQLGREWRVGGFSFLGIFPLCFVRPLAGAG